MKYYLYNIIDSFGESVILLLRNDGAQIPMTEENSDYCLYLAWIAEGNTAEEWQPES